MSSTAASVRSYGYHGFYRHVDLNTGSARDVPLPASVLRRFIGGSGLGTYLLLSHGSAAFDPLSPEAAIVFVFSPLVGSPLTTSAKFAVLSKSPLTERINDSLASSGFAIAGKQCGCDAILITGRAKAPSILIVDEKSVSVQSAEELWGLEVGETEAALHERLGNQYQFAVIGPSGENSVRYATISHDGRHAGRGGSGAVLGSKQIKAVAVRGNMRTQWAHPDELFQSAKDLSTRSFGPATAKYRELGTASNLLVFNRLNSLPTRNFQHGSFDGAIDLSPEQLSTTRQKARATCTACTIGCQHIYQVGGPGTDESHGVRVEYENLFALGPLCGIRDPDIVLAASQRCDQLGLDTISAGGTIAFAMECVQRGLLDAPWLQFGDGHAMLRILDMIAAREGLGAKLAEGSRRLAEFAGHNSIDFAPQVKGLELPGYEPRALQTMALGFAVGTRGADHNRSGAYNIDFSQRVDRRNVKPDDAVFAIETEDAAALMDSLILCKFLRGVFDDFAAEAAHMLHLVTGWDITADELLTTAERIVTAKKLFNIEAGWTPDEDQLPARFLQQPLPEDHRATISRERLSQLIAAYNEGRGWSPNGFVSSECLERLQLAEL